MMHEQQQHVSRLALWFGVLGGAIAWAMHLVLAYLIAEFGCETETDAIVYRGIMLPAWMLLGQSALMITVSSASIVSAAICLRRVRRIDPDAATVQTESQRHLARAGVVSGGLFTFIIAVQTIPVFFYLSSC